MEHGIRLGEREFQLETSTLAQGQPAYTHQERNLVRYGLGVDSS